MLILQGGQGVGKTTLLRYLCPEHLRHDHYYEGSINDDRDTLVSIARSLIIVDDELESLTKREAEKIKSLITSSDKRVRLAYGRAETTLRRRGSFAGSVNRRSFLNDETGSRRFAVISIGGFVDLGALFSIDVDAVWSQALALKRAGFQYWTSPKDIERISAMNANYAVSTEADDLVWRYVEALPTESAAGMSNTEIMTMLQDKIFQEKNAKIPWLNTYQLGRALTKAGFTQVVVKDGGRALRVWKVKIRAIGRSVSGESEPAKVHELRSSYVQGANDAF
jgi:predicted P-loop ATPase